jgi:hypothetical protein
MQNPTVTRVASGTQAQGSRRTANGYMPVIISEHIVVKGDNNRIGLDRELWTHRKHENMCHGSYGWWIGLHVLVCSVLAETITSC